MNEVKNIANKLRQIWKKVYIVWGFCRDKILWLMNDSDIDLTTDATPDEMKEVLKVVKEIWVKYGTVIVSEWGKYYEITTFRKDIWTVNYRKPAKVEFTKSLEEDAKRRDFTCNALYYDVSEERIIDPFNWISDIKKWLIRFVWNVEDRLNEDVLRILRFIRFKHKYWFQDAEDNYFSTIEKHVSLLEKLPIERIKAEFDKILIHNSNTCALKELKGIGFLKVFLQEVDILNTTPWGPRWHYEWNVWVHTLMAIEELNKHYLKHGYSDYALDMYWSVLLHDIWKASTYKYDDEKNIHYYDHDIVSGKMFRESIAKRFKFSNKSKSRIDWVVKKHLRICMLPKMSILKSYELINNKYFKDLELLFLVDSLWRTPQSHDLIKKITLKTEKLKWVFASKKLLTGNDIIEKFPNLEWRDIGNKLKELNSKILLGERV